MPDDDLPPDAYASRADRCLSAARAAAYRSDTERTVHWIERAREYLASVEEADPGCVHAWVSGSVRPLADADDVDADAGFEMVTRQCRRCGYEAELPPDARMRFTPSPDAPRDDGGDQGQEGDDA